MIIRYAGDSTIVIVFGDKINEELNKKVLGVAKSIESNFDGIEVVPTYSSIYVYYNPLQISYSRLVYEIKSRINEVKLEESDKIIEIPVKYGGEFGPDLKFVASYNSLTVEEVITFHSTPVYRVYMLGFLPGFAYLGGMNEKIAVPRLKDPRLKVPAGSVGIAEKQTGWYAIESPGGWRIIGRVPLKMFAPERDPPTIVIPGDHIKFKPIDEDEFYKIYNREWGGSYN